MRRRQTLSMLGLAAAGSLAAPVAAWAQAGFADKTIRIVVPYPPGGATDLSARLLAGEMMRQMGQSVIVENRPGVAGVIGTEYVAKSPPDGSTLVFGGAGNLTLRPLMDPNIPYKVERDLVPISHIVIYDHLLVVRNGLPARSVPEFIQLARERKLSYGSSGTGGPQHLAMELFTYMTQTEMTHVPYKGESQALLDLVGERVDASIISTAAVGQLIRSSKVRALAAATFRRSKSFPELPTISEAGVPGYEMTAYGGLLAPAHTPAPVIDRLARAAIASMKAPTLQQQFYDAGLFPIGTPAAGLSKLLRDEREKWAPIIKKSGATLE
jgi:tripartite-type tricarboxylate transporter receptor subunit TctC